jgi:GST-like protein
MPQAPIEVFYWPTPNGHKVTIALEEMGLPYVIRAVNIGRGDQFTPDFLAISPNNRMPAITDPDGPGGQPISIFESGAILQYLGRKTGQFYPTDERRKVVVDEWVHWQMANLGPNAGQRNHFRNYAPTMVADSRQTAYGAIRYTNEVHRLYGVLNGRLKGRDYVADDYSIADMVNWPWISGQSSDALEMSDFPDLAAWKARVGEREAVKRALAASSQVRSAAQTPAQDPGARSVLFGQRARM